MDYTPIAGLSKYSLPAITLGLSIRRISNHSAQLHTRICCTYLFPKSPVTRQIHSLDIRVLRLLSDSTEQFLPPRVFLPIDMFSGVRYAFLSNQQVLFAQLFPFRVGLCAIQTFFRRLPPHAFMISSVFGQVKLAPNFSLHSHPITFYALTFIFPLLYSAYITLFFLCFMFDALIILPRVILSFLKTIEAPDMSNHCIFASASHADSMCLIPSIHFFARHKYLSPRLFLKFFPALVTALSARSL
jgi:hypothetical protein